MTLTLTNLTKQYGNFTALENFTYDFTAEYTVCLDRTVQANPPL